MAKFFKSLWFKCAIVLLLITAVSGGLLAVLNDVLYVTPQERTDRAIKKIYGEVVEYTVLYEKQDENDNTYEYEFGNIEKIYSVGNETTNYDLLFKATGYQGYKNGTITLWIRVEIDGENAKIEKVILESYEKQTLMSKLGDSFYNAFCKDVENKFEVPVSGASFSAKAGNNAVNCVVEYLKGGAK